MSDKQTPVEWMNDLIEAQIDNQQKIVQEATRHLKYLKSLRKIELLQPPKSKIVNTPAIATTATILPRIEVPKYPVLHASIYKKFIFAENLLKSKRMLSAEEAFELIWPYELEERIQPKIDLWVRHVKNERKSRPAQFKQHYGTMARFKELQKERIERNLNDLKSTLERNLSNYVRSKHMLEIKIGKTLYYTTIPEVYNQAAASLKKNL